MERHAGGRMMENERIEAILFTTDRYEFFMCADPYAHRPAMTVKKAVKADDYCSRGERKHNGKE